jgi:tripartite-type tricarboxylate transporter receptor subunit TctC
MAQGKTPLKNEQFDHIARISLDPLLLLVPASSPHKTLEQFMAHMKRNPGKVAIGASGDFNTTHVLAAMTARSAGVGYVYVPYTGGARVVTDLAGGHLEAGILKPSESRAQIAGGYIRPLGVYAVERLAAFPDVPTFKENGHDVFAFGPVVQMAYLVAPAGLPADVRERLTGVFRTALRDPRFKQVAEQNAFLVDDLSGDALTAEVTKVGQAIGTIASKVLTP